MRAGSLRWAPPLGLRRRYRPSLPPLGVTVATDISLGCSLKMAGEATSKGGCDARTSFGEQKEDYRGE